MLCSRQRGRSLQRSILALQPGMHNILSSRATVDKQTATGHSSFLPIHVGIIFYAHGPVAMRPVLALCAVGGLGTGWLCGTRRSCASLLLQLVLLVGLHTLPCRVGELASRTRTCRGVLIVYRLAWQPTQYMRGCGSTWSPARVLCEVNWDTQKGSF